MKKIISKEEYCIGCRLCEIHCTVAHTKTKNILKVFKGKDTKPLPKIKFEEKGFISFSLQCRHCEEANCIEACITGALYRDEKTGTVLWDENKCVGCWMCIMLCPFGVIEPDLQKKKISSKCDLCINEGFPVCVKNCPNEALVIEE
ncbi:MAG TPA: 4Fe-4S dicluster domain-containing protein [bacterium]|nr:4Fe-4S dicluster domain-containing protein [bacterium]HOL48211.1 4Fe-4S dicluster domain-containing protein [bacterium]HPQ19196.1 4Fe-4S dicluster domain-containing protein [bacterium]